MYGRKHQWVIMGTYSNNWWKKNLEDTNCTLEEIETALQHTLLTDLLPLSTSGEITISGIVSEIVLNLISNFTPNMTIFTSHPQSNVERSLLLSQFFLLFYTCFFKSFYFYTYVSICTLICLFLHSLILFFLIQSCNILIFHKFNKKKLVYRQLMNIKMSMILGEVVNTLDFTVIPMMEFGQRLWLSKT